VLVSPGTKTVAGKLLRHILFSSLFDGYLVNEIFSLSLMVQE